MNKFRNSFLVIAAALFILGGCKEKEKEEKTFGMEIDQTDTYNFPPVEAGSGYTVAPLTVTVTNTGNQATGAIQIALSGTAADKFEVAPSTINIEAGKTAQFTVTPKSGLPEGNYTATVTVGGGNANIVAQFFVVTFKVETEKTYRITLSQAEAYDFDPVNEGEYSVTPLTVTVKNDGNQATGNLQIALSGVAADKFELSANTIASIDWGKDATFTVKPILTLTEGIYSATVTVSGSEKIESKSFNVGFEVFKIVELVVVSPLSKTEYAVGEPFDLTDLVVRTTTGTSVVITDDDLVYDFSTPGNGKTVTIKKNGYPEVEIDVIIKVKSLAERIAEVLGTTATIILYGNEEVAGTIAITGGAATNITLTTAGNNEVIIKKTVAGNLISITGTQAARTKLTMDGYVTLKGLSTATYGGTDVINNNTYLVSIVGGEMVMRGHSKVTGNTNFLDGTGTATTLNGGGIGIPNSSYSCSASGGTLTLEGDAEVSYNNVVNLRGVFNPSNPNLNENSAYGGGIYSAAYNSIYIKDNAKITKNQCIANTRSHAAALFHSTYSVCYMQGGEISDNVAKSPTGVAAGGAIFNTMETPRFFMSGGVMKGNGVEFGFAGRGGAIAVANYCTVVLSGSAKIICDSTKYTKNTDYRNSLCLTNSSRLNISGDLSNNTEPIILDVLKDWFYGFETGFDPVHSPARVLLVDVTGTYSCNTSNNTNNPAAVEFTNNAPIGKFQLGRSYNIDTGVYKMLDSEVELKPTGYLELKEE